MTMLAKYTIEELLEVVADKDREIFQLESEIEDLSDELCSRPWVCPDAALRDFNELEEYHKLRAYIRDQLSVYKIDSLDHQLFHQELQNKMGMPMTIGGLYK